MRGIFDCGIILTQNDGGGSTLRKFSNTQEISHGKCNIFIAERVRFPHQTTQGSGRHCLIDSGSFGKSAVETPQQ